jgi:hypothetical protein
LNRAFLDSFRQMKFAIGRTGVAMDVNWSVRSQEIAQVSRFVLITLSEFLGVETSDLGLYGDCTNNVYRVLSAITSYGTCDG